jgi:hypothetical protein
MHFLDVLIELIVSITVVSAFRKTLVSITVDALVNLGSCFKHCTKAPSRDAWIGILNLFSQTKSRVETDAGISYFIIEVSCSHKLFMMRFLCYNIRETKAIEQHSDVTSCSRWYHKARKGCNYSHFAAD